MIVERHAGAHLVLSDALVIGPMEVVDVAHGRVLHTVAQRLRQYRCGAHGVREDRRRPTLGDLDRVQRNGQYGFACEREVGVEPQGTVTDDAVRATVRDVAPQLALGTERPEARHERELFFGRERLVAEHEQVTRVERVA